MLRLRAPCVATLQPSSRRRPAALARPAGGGRHHQLRASEGDEPSTSGSAGAEAWARAPLLLASALLAGGAGPALAAMEEAVAYNSGGNEETVKNAAGIAYVVLVAYFLFKVLTKRAKRARSQVRSRHAHGPQLEAAGQVGRGCHGASG